MDPTKSTVDYQLKPRFKLISQCSVQELETKLNSALKKREFHCIGKIQYGYGTISIIKKEQHFWSPQLSISLEKTEEGTEIRGHYGPKPSVWTLFVFFYSTIALLTLLITMIGFSRLFLGKPSDILWFSPLLVLVFFSLYAVSRLGKNWGKSQLITLHHFFKTAIGMEFNDPIQ